MLKEKIKSDSTQALKSKDQEVLSVLRMLSAAIFSKEKEKRYTLSKEKPELSEEALNNQSALDDEQVVGVVSSEIKKRKDAIALYEQGNRQELADKEKKEIAVLQHYLPEQLSEEELKKIVAGAIEKTGAKEIKDMGKVMAEVNPKIKGKADGGTVSKIVKELLAK